MTYVMHGVSDVLAEYDIPKSRDFAGSLIHMQCGRTRRNRETFCSVVAALVGHDGVARIVRTPTRLAAVLPSHTKFVSSARQLGLPPTKSREEGVSGA